MENQEEIEYIHLERDRYVYSENPESVTEYPLYKAYLESVIASEGFDVKDERLDEEDDYIGIINSVSEFGLDAEDLVKLANDAVEEFNRLKGNDLVFRRLVRVCGILLRGYLAYLTLECTNGRFYEARIYEEKWSPLELSIFRPAKHYHPTPSKTENSEDCSVTLGSSSEKSKIGSDKNDYCTKNEYSMCASTMENVEPSICHFIRNSAMSNLL